MPRIRIHLVTPVAIYAQKPFAPLMLDGILGYAWALKNGYTKTPAESNPENLVFPELPLEKIGEKCYAASAAFIPPTAVMKPSRIIRRADWKDAMARRGVPATTYETAVGWQQACQEPYWELSTPYIDFYYQGDKKAVLDLLSIVYKIRFIGSKRSAGYGQIRKIEHQDNSENWAVWRGDGLPARPLPVALVGEKPGMTPEWTTYYPPYWAAVNSEWCYVPPPGQWLPKRSVMDIAEKLENVFDRKTEKIVSGVF